MKITIHTEGWFDAAHHLEGHGGPCANLHGHTYKLEIWVRGDETQLNKTGILWDFGYLKTLIMIFDHKGDLTEIMGKNSTAENQVLSIYRSLLSAFPSLQFKVRVYEQIQPKESWAEVGDF